MKLTENDFDQKNVRSFEWTADNKLRRFRITRNDGTVKEILFSDIVADRKLRELIEKDGELQSIINECQDTDGYISVKHLKEKLLEKSKT